jgi:3-oxoadipate enol-lactonase
MKHRPRPQVYWRQSGAGPALVLLNGWSASGIAWPRAWVRELEHDFRVIRVDNRGSGYSRFADTPFTLADMADDVAAVIEAAGHERATVLGLSMGGMIAQEFALRHPARLEALMLVGTRPPAPADVLPPWSQLGELLRPQNRRERLDDYMRRLWAGAVAEGFAEREPAAIEELIAQIIARPTTREMLTHQLRAVSGWAHPERLAGIAAPTVVVSGAVDPFVPPANGRRLAELIPEARYVELPGVGHLAPLEASGEVRDLLKELVLSVGATGKGHAVVGSDPPASSTWH